MAIIAGTTVRWEFSPRIIIIPTSETEINLEDLQDTLQDLEDNEEGMVFQHLRNMSGGEDLGGGTSVGFTMELQNSQVMWATNVVSLDTGTITTPDTTGVTLTDSTGLFVTNGVVPGDMVVNSTDGSHATILNVVSETELTTDGLQGGTDDQFDSADAYEVFDWQLRNVTGGNLVAVDGVGSPIEPLLPSFGNYATKTSSSSATVQELGDIQHASFDGGIHVDVTSSQTGDAYPSGNSANPVNNWTDAVVINAREGFNKYFVRKSTTLPSGLDFTDAAFQGASIIDTILAVATSAQLDKAEFFNVSLEGVLGETTIMENCFLGETNELEDVRGVIEDCSIGPAKLTLGGISSSIVRFVNCRGAGSQFSPPTINCGGNGPEIDIQDYVGQLNIENKTGTAVFEISIQGKLTLDSTVTNGVIIVNGSGVLEDNSGAGATVINNMIQGVHLSELWKLQGLEENNPMTVTPTLRSTADGSINLGITGDGVTTTTVTRQADPAIVFNAPLTTDLTDSIGSTETFSRASTGTYIDPTSSLIVSAAIDTPRFELEGLLIEESRENLCVRSQELNTTWTQDNVTISADAAVAPDGTSTADEIDEGTNFGFHRIFQTCTVSGGADIQTVSAFVKDVDRQYVLLGATRFGEFYCTADLQSGTITDTGAGGGGSFDNATIEAFPNDWYRVTVSGTSGGDTTLFPILRLTNSATGTTTAGTGQTGTDKTLYAWGLQLEPGTFATSYIPTVAATVTRSADFLTYDDDTVVGDPAGSIICDLTPLYGAHPNDGVVVNVANQLAGPMYVVDDTTNKLAISDATLVSSFDPSFTENATITSASRWSTVDNEIQTVAGGFAGTAVAYDDVFTRTLGTLYIGSDSTGNHFNGNIKNLLIYNTDRGENQLLVDTA